MDFSEDIEEESPCLIVPDSQTEERGTVQGCDPTHGCSLKELAMSRPTILPAEVSTSSGETEDGSREPKANNQIVGENVVEKDYIDKETGDRRGSGQDENSSKSSGRDGTEQCNEGFENQSEKVVVPTVTSSSSSSDSALPNSGPTSSSWTHSSSLSIPSSKEEFCQKNLQNSKSEKKMHAVRKVINGSNGISSSKEDLFANWQQGQKFLTSTPLVSSCSVVSSYNAINRRVPHLTPSEETSPTEMFQCLQLSGDIKAKETSSSDDVVSPSYDNFKPSSPSMEGSESNLLKEFDKEDSNKKQGDMVQSTVAKKPDDENIISPKETVGGYQNETSLPKWQKDCILEESEKTYSTRIGGTLSQTTSEISTDNAIIISSVGEGSSLQQWQSQQNDSDELFENDNSTPTNTNFINLQVHNGSQLPHANGLILPELSEDIFHPRAKSLDDRPIAEKKVLSPTENGITSSSQEDNVFRLYLTQSQSSDPPSQVPAVSRTEYGKQSEPFLDVARNESDARLSASPSQSILPQTFSSKNPADNNQMENPRCPGNITEAVFDKEPELSERNANVGYISLSSPSCKMVTCSRGAPCPNGNTMKESLVSPREAPHTTDDTAESTESGNVAFHFSLPSVLLRPAVPTAPSPCLESNSESQGENLKESSPPEIVVTSEFKTVLPEVSKKILSLSAPAPYEESTDEDINSPDFEFNLKKAEFVSDPETAKVVGRTARSVFTNVRERFKVASMNCRKDERDLFEFTDEVCSHPLRKRMTKRMEGKRDRSKRRLTAHESLDSNVSNGKRKDVDNLGGNGRKRKKINEISENIGLHDLQLHKETDQSKRTFWKVVKTRTITTTTTLVERETIITYTDVDGNVLVSETKHEFDEPTHATKATDGEETREAVEEIPAQKSSTNDKNDSAASSKTDLNQSSNNLAESELKNNKHKRSSSVGLQRSSRKKCLVQMSEAEDLHEGCRVLAQWFDKHYYPGTIVSKNEADSKYRVDFDDGDSSYIREEDILAVEYLPPGQPVMVREEHGDCYDNGVIRGFYQTRHKRGYKVAQDDGTVQKCARSRVILDAEQAAIFLSLHFRTNESNKDITNEYSGVLSPNSSDSITKRDRSSDACSSFCRRSGDKVSGSKISHQKVEAKSGTSCDKGANASRTAYGKTMNASLTSSEKANESNDVEDWVRTSHKIADVRLKCIKKQPMHKSDTKQRRLSTSETPKSSHKSTVKTSTTGDKMGNNGDKGNGEVQTRVGKVRRRLSCAMQMVSDKTRAIPTRTSPRKIGIKSNTQVNDENLVLPTNQDLFIGYGFVITGSDVNPVSCGEENSPREEEHTFSRSHVRRQVEVGGGVVLPTFHEDSGAGDSYLLLSNSYQTTAKYFYALVVGVPCLSHIWVRDCCSENKLISYKNYLLPAGRDLVTDKLVEEQKCSGALRKMKVYLVGDEEFRVQWKKVLTAAGSEIVNKLPPNVLKDLQYGNQDFNCDVIVVGSGDVSHSTIRKARLYGIPTVTIHWVKQCILTGERVPINAHPSFIYRVKEEK